MEIKEEKELIRQASEDPAAFAAIYEEYYPRIFGYILKRTASVELAQDLTAETFFKALRKLWQFRWRRVPFSAWLYRIATNEMNQYFRRGKLAPASLDELLRQGYEPAAGASPESEAMEAQDELERHREYLLCQEALRRLDAKYQEVIALRFFEKKQINEISAILGKPEGTVKSLLHRGIEKMRCAMQPSDRPRIMDYERSNQLINKYPEL
jgi:RNA polymerase sigma-70 factor (ECF subfamily)